MVILEESGLIIFFSNLHLTSQNWSMSDGLWSYWGGCWASQAGATFGRWEMVLPGGQEGWNGWRTNLRYLHFALHELNVLVSLYAFSIAVHNNDIFFDNNRGWTIHYCVCNYWNVTWVFRVKYMRWLPKDDPHKLVVVHKVTQMDFPQNALPCH